MSEFGVRRCRRAAALPLLCLFGWILAAGAPAAEATTQAFSYTGGEQTFLVPSGVSSIHALVRGGHGGVGGGAGGAAAEVSADFGVTPGQVLYVEVGGNGESSEACGEGGFNGGASGNGSGAGGGGGASDIRLLPRSAGLSSDTRWIVAAGGGGGGGTGSDPGANGGDAGSMGGISLAGNEGGSPGTETEGGAGGSGCGGLGTSGQLGLGGAGGSGEIGVNGGGGGGGGLYGGGGGAGGCTSGAGGGGGGSSLVPPGGALSLATASAAPLVEITYTLPPTSPPATPVPPTAIAPNTLLGSHPARRVKTGKKRANVRFTFSSDVAGATFRCKLDKGTYAPCASPKRFKVKPGKHKFSVEAVKDGLADTTPATFSFKVIKTS